MSTSHIHILGICGTFMGGVAALAREAGFTVSGSDAQVYPPMSTQLESLGIELMQGYRPGHLKPAPDKVIVGNALSRGNPAVEYMLNADLPYTSGPQWLAETMLPGRQVLAVAGTHGKTSTASMLAWILERAGLEPGFLIGGVARNFTVSARLGKGSTFVVEADEYDTAFFDKRSKFVHYRPRVLILNNLEYDHADIFPDLAAIQRQFHHLVRTVPGEGTLIVNRAEPALLETLEMGCWSRLIHFAADASRDADWVADNLSQGGRAFDVLHMDQPACRVAWSQAGRHNVANALAALGAAHAVGVDAASACHALESFTGVKRRLECFGPVRGVTVYDDFAHHPTAIQLTLEALRDQAPPKRLLVALEPRSNSMRAGVHAGRLASALMPADRVYLLAQSGWDWDPGRVTDELGPRGHIARSVEGLFEQLCNEVRAGDDVVFMSNGGFGGIRERFVAWLEENA